MTAAVTDGSRRRWCLAASVSALGLALPTLAQAADRPLPAPESLPQELSRALQRGEPLVVMVSLHGCPFCKVVRESYLWPLREAGVPVVQIDMREGRRLIGWDARPISHDAWVRQHGVRIAPTVLFFGPDAQEVAPRLKGAYLPDFYNAYLEDNLASARRAVQKSPTERVRPT